MNLKIHSKAAKAFTSFTIVLVLWSLVNIILDYSQFVSHSTVGVLSFVNKIGFGLGILCISATYYLTLYFPRTLKVNNRQKAIYIIAGLFSFTALSNSVSGSFEYNGGLVANYTYGSMSYVVGIISVLVFGLSINNVRQSLSINSTALVRKQALTVFFALAITIFTALTFIILIPSFLEVSDRIVFIGYFAPFIFTAALTYSIFKQRLLGFKGIVIRAISYVFTSGIVLTSYILFAFLVKRLILPDYSTSPQQLTSNILLTVAIVITFPRIKKAFDKLSNAFFYRDAYDPQMLLDNLNQTLVSSVDLEELLTKCALIIQENIKTTFCTFYIRKTAYLDERIIGAHAGRTVDNYKSIEQLTSKLSKKVIFTEQVEDDNEFYKLNSLLQSNSIEAVARLVSTLDSEVKGVGYLFLGAKKSGSPYTQQDLTIIEIMANELVIAIENVLRFEEIEQFNVTLQMKIDDATKELKQTNEKLRALDEAKDEFVSMASHQLRTPLTSIKGYLSMVLEGDAGKISGTQKDMLGQAFFSSQRMVYLISDLLNVSRLKTGKFVIEAKPLYLPNVVEEEINQLKEGAKSKNLTLSFSKPNDFATLMLDDMKIRQVIMNFTDNAIYYTPTGGKITIELRDTDKSVEFRVRDTGIGVPKAEQSKLFTKFYRAGNARKARPDGTGLGLFMAKKVVIAQGGAIIFDSKEGKGSTFGFTFPKEKLLVETENKHK